MAFYLGIDIGTSAIKAILLDAEQHQHGMVSVPLTVSRPHEGWSEQNPEDWWQEVDQAISTLAQDHPGKLAQLRGIGLAGQMHGLVALDGHDQPLRGAILWNDTRASHEASWLDQTYPEFRTIAGNMVMAGFTAPKAVWMARHEPDLFAKIKTILLPKDYIRFRLTGQKISDMSDASGTLWLDIAKRRWSEELLDRCGLTMDQMPQLVEGSDPSARLSPDLAERWGIKGEVIIAGGAGDNAAAAIGLGLKHSQERFVSLGTSGVVFNVTDQFSERADKAVHAFCHALPKTWHQMGVILSATDSLTWLTEVAAQPLDALLAQMKKADEHKTWPLFHPYLSGERTPHNNPEARGGFFGLSRADDGGDLARAVMQGVAFAIADAMAVLDDKGGSSDMIATGGGAKNDYWLRLIASVTNTPIAVPQSADICAALGAGRLAMLADGHALDVVCIKPPLSHRIMPDPALADAMKPARQQSQRLYAMMTG